MTRLNVSLLRAKAKAAREGRKSRKVAKVSRRIRRTKTESDQFRACRKNFLKSIKSELETSAETGRVAAEAECRNEYGPGIRALYSAQKLLDKRGFNTKFEEYNFQGSDEVPVVRYTRLRVSLPGE